MEGQDQSPLHTILQSHVGDVISPNVAVNLPASQPVEVERKRRRGRHKSLDILLELPAAKNPKLSSTQVCETPVGPSPKAASGSSISDAATVAWGKQQGSNIPNVPTKCSNKQILEAIKKLTNQISVIENNVTDKIDNLENRLEEKLISKINDLVEVKVSEKVKETTAKLETRVDETYIDIQALNIEKAAIGKEIKVLKEENKHITDALLHHQKYLEALEASKRASNIIITGLPEDDFVFEGESLHSDVEKVQKVFEAIERSAVEVDECVRLGKTQVNRPRIVRLKLKNPQDRMSVLQNSKLLKNKNLPFNKVYLKKDVHPMVRKEFNRLKQAERKEKEKPENEGRNVVYDAASRCILVDDVVVDKFRMSFL